jgi:hypothetical protein
MEAVSDTVSGSLERAEDERKRIADAPAAVHGGVQAGD